MFQFHIDDDLPTAYRWMVVAGLFALSVLVPFAVVVVAVGLSMFPIDREVRLIDRIGPRS